MNLLGYEGFATGLCIPITGYVELMLRKLPFACILFPNQCLCNLESDISEYKGHHCFG